MSMTRVLVSDETWIATALLHREQPHRSDFTVSEIVQRAEQAQVAGEGPLRPGVKVHAYQHCVANVPPRSGRYRMLVETARGRRRLFRPGDPCHAERRSGKAIPREDEIPPAYHELIAWYRTEYAGSAGPGETDPILSLRGMGKALWEDEDADAYVERLREGWR